MKKIKIVVFDVGGTLLNNVNFSFERGVRYLYEEVFDVNVSFNEFFNLFMNLIHNDNNMYIEGQFRAVFQYLNFLYPKKTYKSFYKIELKFARKVYEVSLNRGVKSFLEYLKKKDIPCYVFSNSMFSSKEIKNELKYLKIDKYFKSILSSGDYLYKKPSLNVFSLFTKKFNIDSSQICYIGNTIDTDIMPALKLNMEAIYVNENCNNQNSSYLSVSSFDELLKVWENNYE